MKQVCCIYCEGSDVKLAVLSKEKEAISVSRVASLTLSKSLQTTSHDNAYDDLMEPSGGGDISFDSLDDVSSIPVVQEEDTSDAGVLNSALFGLKLPVMQYIPVVTEPTVNFHVYEGPKLDNKKKLLQSSLGPS